VPYGLGGTAFGPDGSLYFTHGPNVSRLTTDGALTVLAHNVAVENASDSPAGSSVLFGVAVDAQGNAYVADHGNRRVLKISPDRQLSTPVRAEESWFPTGVAVRGGELYILEESHTPRYEPAGTRVRRLSPDGKIAVLATVGENRTSADSPSAGATPPAENSERTTTTPERKAPYALIGAGVGVFALTVIAWRVRRRMADRRHGNG
jgi:hypothetical protein